MGETTTVWLVLRTDDSGNVFLVDDGLSEAAAQELVVELTERGHKQSYVAVQYRGAAARAVVLQRYGVRG